MEGTRPVLVVEDDEDTRACIVEILDDHGYETVAASNGEEALALLRSGVRPALILLDLMMPVMTGFELWDEIRCEPELSDIPVIVVSAVPDLRRIASDMGASGVLEKPVSIEELLEVTARHGAPRVLVH